jgi:hypothetical protein
VNEEKKKTNVNSHRNITVKKEKSALKRYGHLAREKTKKTLYTMESLILAQDER